MQLSFLALYLKQQTNKFVQKLTTDGEINWVHLLFIDLFWDNFFPQTEKEAK